MHQLLLLTLIALVASQGPAHPNLPTCSLLQMCEYGYSNGVNGTITCNNNWDTVYQVPTYNCIQTMGNQITLLQYAMTQVQQWQTQEGVNIATAQGQIISLNNAYEQFTQQIKAITADLKAIGVNTTSINNTVVTTNTSVASHKLTWLDYLLITSGGLNILALAYNILKLVANIRKKRNKRQRKLIISNKHKEDRNDIPFNVLVSDDK